MHKAKMTTQTDRARLKANDLRPDLPAEPHDHEASKHIRIAIVDDHPIVREGLVAVLSREQGFTIVGEGGDAAEAIQLADKLKPHILLLDINMPGDGLAALRRISSAHPEVAVVMLTVNEDPQTVNVALNSGARGYVLKGIGGSELATIVRTVHCGDPYITPTLAGRMLIELASETTGEASPPHPREPQHMLPKLTAREEQILRCVADGQSNKQIAAALELSESTIKHYMSGLMQKLQVKNRVEAALLAQKQRRQP